MLRLVGRMDEDVEPCPTCNGRGKVPCPPTAAVRSGVGGNNSRGPIMQPGAGCPIPCPTCLGKKVVPRKDGRR